MTIAESPLPQVIAPGATGWPPGPGTPIVVLAKGESAVELRVLRRWADSLGALAADSARAAVAAAEEHDAMIVPVRVSRLPDRRDLEPGEARPADVLSRLRLPLPGPLRARWLARLLNRDLGQVRLLVGAPARRSELRARWTERELGPASAGRDEAAEFAAFVDRQADIVLERATRRLRGDRFRAPRAIVAELLHSREFVRQVEELAVRLGRNPEGVLADCRMYLEEMAGDEKRYAIEMWAAWARVMHSRAYDLDVDREQIARLRELSSRHPLMFLPSHRSNLDPYVMFSVTYENGLPLNHVLGGINMMFWPLGAMSKRIGVVGIRRTFRDNPVYRFALSQYLGFMVAKRFNLEWYLEGGRSRTGKLLPPKLGLLNYLADTVEARQLEDVLLIPTAIVYDMLHEAGEMASESRGAVKQAEGPAWLLRYAKQQRRAHLGSAHVRFGEPINLLEALRAQRVTASEATSGDGSAGAERARSRLARRKVAFEVCTRINRATVVTAPALVTFTLLGVGDRALTLPEVRAVVQSILTLALSRGAATDAATRDLATDAGVLRTLTRLVEHGVVEGYDGGAEPVYRIGPEQELVAAFYRNATIHIFVNRAILELAFLHIEASGGGIAAAWRECLRLRDLLKFEFFFADKQEFRAEMTAEVRAIEPDETRWEQLEKIAADLRATGPLVAQRTLRSFVESYAVLADHLVTAEDATVDEKAAVAACLGLGRQYMLQRRVTSSEAVSAPLFRNGLALAANRGLLAAGGDVRARRIAFAAELTDVLGRLEQINQHELARIAAARQALRAGQRSSFRQPPAAAESTGVDR